MMEKDYQADGWLGFIVGSKLWIDFVDENKIESSSLNNLVAEIHRQGFKPDNESEGTSISLINGFSPYFRCF